MSDLMLDVDQAGELKAAFRRGDWTNAEIKRACEGDLLARFRDVVRGYAQIAITKHVVDCDTKPFLPQGWKVEEHKKGGQLSLDMSKIRLHLSPNQMNSKYIEGNRLHKELASQQVLNANVLDYLLAHPELIPEDWKRDADGNTRYIFFWGTVYHRYSGDDLCVRYLYWDDGAWDWYFCWLVSDFRGYNPAAVLAS